VVYFAIPEGTTFIDEDSWKGWGVDKTTLEKGKTTGAMMMIHDGIAPLLSTLNCERVRIVF
jgi:hypothetical protein